MGTYLTYTTNPNEWSRLEGVYVNRKKPDSQVVGVNVNTVGLLGQCVRGPLTPQLVSSPAEATALYGGRDGGGGGTILGQVWLATLTRQFSWPMVIRRVAAAAATAASVEFVSGATHIIHVAASSVGSWGNNAGGYGITAAVVAATDANSDHFNLVVTYAGKTYTYQNLNVSATGVNNLATVIGGDLTNPVVVTKLANGRPTNISAQDLAGGADGSIAGSDFETAFVDVAHMAGVSIVAVCEEAYQPYAAIVLCGADGAPGTAEPTKTFCTCATSYNSTVSSEVAAMAAGITTTARNIVWCYNPSSVLDNSTSTLVEGGSHLDMAAILSQTDADINPGDGDTVALMSGISSVRNTTLTRGDLITLKAGGVAALEKVQGGFQFHSGVATSGAEIADVRTEQMLTASIADYLKYDVKKKMTETRRRNIPAKVLDYLRRMQKAERYVAPDDPDVGPAIKVAWVDVFADRAANMGKLLTQVRTMAHFNYLVLETDMGTGVTIVK
jgi:hypothetical protein